jgi:tRNA pseudouridine38-40 synthase
MSRNLSICGGIVRYALKVAYDGTNYCGWQKQLNGNTVQQKLEEAVYASFNEHSTVTASGRTDSGVHAVGQVCHVDLQTNINGDKLADALNARLPDDISVLSSCVAPDGFDANRTAKKKTYNYNIYLSSRRNPLLDRYAVQVKWKVDMDALREASKAFIGTHDFKAYCASGSQVLTTERTLYDIQVKSENICGAEKVTISVCGNGFLYNMVRTMVGTMLYCAMGKITVDDINKSLTLCDRSLVGKTMPPQGLVLESVDYGIKLFD